MAEPRERGEEAPGGFLTTSPDGAITDANRTFCRWTGFTREQLLDGRTFASLLTVGGRIYHETHFAPLLALQGAVREIAVDIRRADGSRLPVLVNAELTRAPDGQPKLVRMSVFDATNRRRYEQELVAQRDEARTRHETAERQRASSAEVAHLLQQSLLESVPIADPRVRIGARYQPASDALEVGGDWYDAFPIDRRRIGVAVGDVVGRGLLAATAMGQLRSGVRALALAGLSGPAAVLAALDRFAARLPRAVMTTLVYAELDLDDGTLEWVSAGHPPPIAVAPDGTARTLEEGRGFPLGISADAGPLATAGRASLPPGARLVLYSDGVVERHGEPIDRGIARLAAALSASAGEQPQTLAELLVARFAETGSRRDDACLLCVERVR